MAESKMLVFHGSTLPPGTDSRELRKPSLRQPFFVADNPKSALDYAISYHDNGKASNVSVFILKTSKKLDEVAFDFHKDSDVNKLKSKFPKTVKYIHEYQSITDRRYLGKPSFFNAIGSAIDCLRDVSYDGTINKPKRYFDITRTTYFDKRKEGLKKGMFAMMEELGFIEIDENLAKFLPGEMKNIMQADNFWKKELDTTGRRLVKEKIYEEIYNLGYDAVIDIDSSPSGKNLGNEYAVFDMDVFDGGFSNSISLGGIKSTIRKIGEMK